jgi:AcrR family transcriptional regulator
VGKMIEDAVRATGFSITLVAKKLGVTRRTIYNYFDEEHLDAHIIHQFEKLLNLRLLTPEIEESKTSVQITDSAEYWRNKYIELLEKYTQLLEEKKK